MKKKKTGFDEYYREIYPERWDSLKEAFSAPQRYQELSEGLEKPYYLDPASVRVAEQLKVKNAERILDLCAAPGGKTLVVALEMPRNARLVANDRSAQRRGRLKRVIEEHLPEELRERITVTGHDATKWGLYEKEAYDRILLDAPCSSERHVLESETHLAKWSPARTKHLGVQAYAMLASAFMALKPGGRLVYSTCSISPKENQEVVKKLLKKQETAILVDICSDIKTGEEEHAEAGWYLLPDTVNAWGPIYYAVISKKLEAIKENEESCRKLRGIRPNLIKSPDSGA